MSSLPLPTILAELVAWGRNAVTDASESIEHARQAVADLSESGAYAIANIESLTLAQRGLAREEAALELTEAVLETVERWAGYRISTETVQKFDGVTIGDRMVTRENGAWIPCGGVRGHQERSLLQDLAVELECRRMNTNPQEATR